MESALSAEKLSNKQMNISDRVHDRGLLDNRMNPLAGLEPEQRRRK